MKWFLQFFFTWLFFIFHTPKISSWNILYFDCIEYFSFSFFIWIFIIILHVIQMWSISRKIFLTCADHHTSPINRNGLIFLCWCTYQYLIRWHNFLNFFFLLSVLKISFSDFTFINCERDKIFFQVIGSEYIWMSISMMNEYSFVLNETAFFDTEIHLDNFDMFKFNLEIIDNQIIMMKTFWRDQSHQ